MRIDSIELRWVTLPLVTPFRTSVFTEYDREALLIAVRTADGVTGWGECVAMSQPIYSPESIGGVVDVLRRHLIPLVEALPRVSAEAAAEAFQAIPGHPNAKGALEMALLDAELRIEGRSLAARLGAVRPAVRSGVSVGIMSAAELTDTIQRYWHKDGYCRIKLKVQPGWDEEPIRIAREVLGDEAALQVDANGAYTRDDIEHLRRLDDYGLLMIEQPFATEDLAGHAELARVLQKTPVCLDEPITCAADAIRALDMKAASIINIKPGRVGGYLEAKKIHDVCAGRDVPVWVGGMLETGLGRAANVALAALPHFTLVGDISASERFFTRDITPPIVMRDGHIAVPTGPGIGVEPDKLALKEATERIESIPFRAKVLA